MKIGVSVEDRCRSSELSTIAYWKIRARLLRVPGVANVAIWGERLRAGPRGGRPDAHAAQRRDARPGRWRPPPTSLDAGLLRFTDGQRDRHRRVRRHAEPAARRPARPADRDAARPRPGPGQHDAAARRVRLGDVAQRQRAAPAARRRRGRQRRARGCCSSSRSARGRNTLEVTHGRRGRRSRSCGRVFPASSSTRTIFRPANFIETALDNLTAGAAARLPARDPGARRVPLRVAYGADQPHLDPAVAGGRRARALRAGHTINMMILAGLVIALGVVVDDAIIDIENIWRRLRQHRADGQHEVEGARSSSRRRSRCGARSCTRR